MNKRLTQVSYLLLVSWFIGCTPKVIHFTDLNATFSNYETFGITNYKNTKDLSAEGKEVFLFIENQITEQLRRRDYSQNTDEPDIVVRYEFIANQRTDVSTNYNPYGFYSPFPNRRSYSVRTILESALLVELFDSQTKKLVWQGSLDLNKANKKNSQEEILGDAITKIFNTYLYRAKSNTPDQSLVVE
ncbi:DUF4136 domain-containing protein [Marinoscillum sp.]|uniref:DUF4136 domain-containing protein n=1 Tax=Marinoscillum sp. TaxID=2024838 RepID=UPI003BA850BF